MQNHVVNGANHREGLRPLFRRNTTDISSAPDDTSVTAELRAGGAHFRSAANATAEAAARAWSGARTALADRTRRRRRDADVIEVAPDPEPTTRVPALEHHDVLLPMVADFLTSIENRGNNVSVSSKQLQREANRRAKGMARALRGERQRKWPWVAAAFAAGTTVGVLIGLLVGREGGPWQQLRDSSEDVRAKLGRATTDAKQKAADRAGDAVDRSRQALGNKADKLDADLKDLEAGLRDGVAARR